MWPGFDSQTWRHMWVEFVGSLLCTERFSPDSPVSPLLKNRHLTWFTFSVNFRHLNKVPFLFKIPDIYFSSPVLFIQLTFHSLAPLGYILFKDPPKRHLRFNLWRHCRLIKHSTVSTREIYAFLLPPEILPKYSEKTLRTKTPLSKGVIGKIFPDTENKRKEKQISLIFRLRLPYWQPSK